MLDCICIYALLLWAVLVLREILEIWVSSFIWAPFLTHLNFFGPQHCQLFWCGPMAKMFGDPCSKLQEFSSIPFLLWKKQEGTSHPHEFRSPYYFHSKTFWTSSKWKKNKSRVLCTILRDTLKLKINLILHASTAFSICIAEKGTRDFLIQEPRLGTRLYFRTKFNILQTLQL